MTVAAGPVDAAVDSCDLVWVDGPDAGSFLQGLLSNDVEGLEPGASCLALILDAKGHVRGEMRVLRGADDGFTLVTGPGRGDRLVELLDAYHFSEDVDVVGPERFALVTLLRDDVAPPATGVDLVLAGRVPGSIDLVGADAGAILAGLPARVLDRAQFDAVRVEAGIPAFGVDVTEGTLVHEAGLETSAVSFEKGCYLGQETVARVQYRGRVNRRLRGLALPGLPAPGATVRHDGREVGRVSSVAVSARLGPIALAILRSEAPPGSAVSVEGIDGAATVVDLPFTKPLQ